MGLAEEADWTTVARSIQEPAAAIVLPDETFELDDLRELARALEDAGLPVLIAESPSTRRIVDHASVSVLIQASPVFRDILTGVAASAAWDGVKAAFGRLRRRGEAAQTPELSVDLRVRVENVVVAATGPVTQAITEVAVSLTDPAKAQAESHVPVKTKPAQQSG
jgi:hypothetical protein